MNDFPYFRVGMLAATTMLIGAVLATYLATNSTLDYVLDQCQRKEITIREVKVSCRQTNQNSL